MKTSFRIGRIRAYPGTDQFVFPDRYRIPQKFEKVLQFLVFTWYDHTAYMAHFVKYLQRHGSKVQNVHGYLVR